ncbi:hypothetical protein RHMOL_Rhmol05G0290800 [Rhododendron molle]|uniref:Uncharacterized protein n=1 Tax=Rhododendron molle TaxID=49168 RepID=A0ACC0NUJ1_RHOML|nr:hypothetical protein RHMOL_Rhmol05G0290800 [Rhododendron molle]
MRSDSSSRRSSASEPDGAEVVYWKDNVTIHPTQYASERISGRLKLIKQGPSLFMTWIPYKGQGSNAKLSGRDRNLYTIRACSAFHGGPVNSSTHSNPWWQYIIIVLSSATRPRADVANCIHALARRLLGLIAHKYIDYHPGSLEGIGLAFGIASVLWLGFIFNDTVIEIALTLAVSYSAFCTSKVLEEQEEEKEGGTMAGSQSTASRTTFHLPLEITIEILSRLPVKTLLRFKSVCRNWYALIKTPDFISKHLQTHSTPNSTSLLLTKYNHNTQDYAMSLLSNDGSSGPIEFPFLTPKNYNSIRDLTRRHYISFLGERTRKDFSVAGVCNGLVCFNLSRFGFPLILCNPSTREFREIPNSEWNWLDENGFNCFIRVRQASFGFGFHPSANDYKLIRIVFLSTPMREDNIRADLYVMSTDTWTVIAVNKLSLFFGEMDVFGEEYIDAVEIVGSSASAVLNGVFYWPARVVPTDQMVVMSFDLGDEMFRKIRTPVCLDRTWDGTNWKFMEFDDKLALVVSPDERGFDVWVLNEKESSWTKQVKVGSLPRIATVYGDNTVVGGGKNSELLVTEHKVSRDLKLFSYDTKTGETKDLFFGHAPYQSFVYLCAGTLLPVMQANEVALH